MDDDRRDLVNGLFAVATAMLEDATELAMAGQSRDRVLTQLASDGRLLASAAQDIAIIAQAAAIIADPSNEHRNRNRP
ncbi:MAG: hypothetical protein AAF414_15770 [Pseudomonadota bacterium]